MELRRKISIVKKVLEAKFLGKKKPIAVSWAITNQCNLHCAYCNIWKNEKDEVSTQEAQNIINQLSENGTELINFTGGEPLLREDIGEIISYTKQKNIFTSLNTNGSLVKKKIEEISSLDRVSLSFDGSEQVQDRIRGKGKKPSKPPES